MVIFDGDQVPLMMLRQSIEVVAGVERKFRPCCLGVGPSGGGWLRGRRELRRTTLLVALRSLSSSTDGLERKELLLGQQYMEGLEKDDLSSAETGHSGNHHPNSPPLNIIISIVFASRVSNQ